MKDKERVSWTSMVATLAIIGLMTAGAIPSARADEPIIPVNANAYGNTYGDWNAMWWQWALSIPKATNPNLDTTGANCDQKQAGPVWFLGATLFGGSFTRSCTVPAGKALFFPILPVIFGAAVFDCEPTVPGVACNLADLRVSAAAALPSVTLTATIDHRPLHKLEQQRVQSPVLTITYPDNSALGPAKGTYAPNVSDGYWLLLPPLHAGYHTIYFKGVISGGPFNGFEGEVTYYLTVRQ